MLTSRVMQGQLISKPESQESNRAPGRVVVRPAWKTPVDIRSIALTVLAVLAVTYTLYFAKGLILPIVLAAMLGFLLAPPVRLLHRLGIPEAIGAAVVVLFFFAVLGYATYRVTPAVAELVEQAPQLAAQFERKVRYLREPVDQMTEAADSVGRLASTNGSANRTEVEIRQPSLVEAALSQTPTVLFGGLTALVLLYFFLASGDLFLGKLVRVLPRLQDKKRMVEVVRRVERIVSRYLFSITLINFSLGVLVAGAMSLLGMPNPLLWGIAAGVLNFVPFLGSLLTAVVMAVVATVTFEETWQIVLPPLVYLSLTALEGAVFTPLILGRRLALNPVVIFVSLLVWGALWGVAGVLLAVPLLVVLKVLCDQIEALCPVGEFLGR